MGKISVFGPGDGPAVPARGFGMEMDAKKIASESK
jgi:hypothetical protein